MASIILCVDNTQVVKLYLAQSGASRRMQGVKILLSRQNSLHQKVQLALKTVGMYARTDLNARHDDILVVGNLLAAALFERCGPIKILVERGDHLRHSKTVESGLPHVLEGDDLL